MARILVEGLVVVALLGSLSMAAERARSVRPFGGAHPSIDVERLPDGKLRDADALVSLSEGLLDQGRLDEAHAALTAALARAPRTGRALFAMARCRQARGQSGIEVFDRAWRERPGRVPIALAAGRFLAGSGDAAGAEARYRLAVMAAPRDPAGWVALADLWTRTGRLEEALDACQRALTLAPGSADAFVAAGWLAWQRGDDEAAEREFDQAVRAEPYNAAGYLALAFLESRGHHMWGLHRKLATLLELPDVDAGALCAAGQACGSEREREILFYRRALELDPHCTRARHGIARCATVERVNGMLVNWLRAWRAEDPYDPVLARAAAEIAEAEPSRSQETAVREMEATCASAPHDAALALEHADLLARTGPKGPVLAAQEQAMDRIPSSPHLAAVTAEVAQASSPRAADRAWRVAVSAARGRAHAGVALAAAGWFDERRNDFAAEEALAAAVAADPDSPRLRLEQATWYLRRGRKAEAEAALSSPPVRVDPLWHAGGDEVLGRAVPESRAARPDDERVGHGWTRWAAKLEGEGSWRPVAFRAAAGRAAALAVQHGWPAGLVRPWRARLAAADGVVAGVRVLAEDPEVFRRALGLAMLEEHAPTPDAEPAGRPAGFARRLGGVAALACLLPRLTAGTGQALLAEEAGDLDVDELAALLALARPGMARWRTYVAVGKLLGHSYRWSSGVRGRIAYERAILAHPDDLTALDELVDELSLAGDEALAARGLSCALALPGGETGERTARFAHMRWRAGERSEAARLYERASQLGASNADLARCVWDLADAGFLPEATRIAGRLAKQETGPEALMYVAWIEMQSGKPEEAQEIMARALERTFTHEDILRVETYARQLGFAPLVRRAGQRSRALSAAAAAVRAVRSRADGVTRRLDLDLSDI